MGVAGAGDGGVGGGNGSAQPAWEPAGAGVGEPGADRSDADEQPERVGVSADVAVQRAGQADVANFGMDKCKEFDF